MSSSAVFGFSITGPAPAAYTVTLEYRGSSIADRIELTGAQTYVIDLAMMPAAGLKGLLVRLEDVDASNSPVTQYVTMTWTSNAVSKSERLSPGGFFALCSPSPVGGITALSIVSTANAVVRVTALG